MVLQQREMQDLLKEIQEAEMGTVCIAIATPKGVFSQEV